jgi:pyrroloquinoline quinone biosynthesis protein B
MPGVRVHVLGTVQDGGLPHPGCSCANCKAARKDVALRRRVVSVAIEGKTGRTLLIDASPDFRDQLDALADAVGRPPPAVDEIVITHAHVGHYLGLAFLGKEAMHAPAMPVYCTPSVARFLEGNRPWSHLVEREEIDLRTLAPGRPHAFDGAMVHAFLSPHRGEDTDTLGFEIVGPTRRLVYVSDADVFPPAIVERIKEADVALVDGTFYDEKELPNRDMLAVRHPTVRGSLPRLAGGRGQVYFTHMNHTNPLLDPRSPERSSLPAGFHVLEEGAVFDL